tara:strand:- start:286 stop:930 length:645 start_codon:yes stop_codon:yes gene_type:complete
MTPGDITASNESGGEHNDEKEYFGGARRYFDANQNITVVNVHAGDCFITDSDEEMATTVLGSCISACVRDPVACVGGMNHFLLPSSKGSDMESTRYGAFAMEQLINEILKRGGKRERLEIKIFGGGNVLRSVTGVTVGDKNIQFIREYLKVEGFTITTEDVGGNQARKVKYYPYTGKAFIKKIERSLDIAAVNEEETKYQKDIASDEGADDVLF